LEQLRKRQRDEAIEAQRELLAGVAKATPIRLETSIAEVSHEQRRTENEDVETYDRSMSPEPIDLRTLSYEDRDMDIVSAEDDLKALVSLSTYVFFLFNSYLL